MPGLVLLLCWKELTPIVLYAMLILSYSSNNSAHTYATNILCCFQYYSEQQVDYMRVQLIDPDEGGGPIRTDDLNSQMR